MNFNRAKWLNGVDNMHYESHHFCNCNAFDLVDECKLEVRIGEEIDETLVIKGHLISPPPHKASNTQITSMACFIVVIMRSVSTSLYFSANN